jgi:hypothetical protein
MDKYRQGFLNRYSKVLSVSKAALLHKTQKNKKKNENKKNIGGIWIRIDFGQLDLDPGGQNYPQKRKNFTF